MWKLRWSRWPLSDQVTASVAWSDTGSMSRLWAQTPSFPGQPPNLLGGACSQISITACTPQTKITTHSIFISGCCATARLQEEQSQIPYASTHTGINFLLNSTKLVSNSPLQKVHCNVLGWPDTSVSSGMGLVSPTAQHAGNITLTTWLIRNYDKADMGTLSKHPQRGRGSFIAFLQRLKPCKRGATPFSR